MYVENETYTSLGVSGGKGGIWTNKASKMNRKYLLASPGFRPKLILCHLATPVLYKQVHFWKQNGLKLCKKASYWIFPEFIISQDIV